MEKNQDTKPILKWVGGKTQIVDKLVKHFPKEINNYHEIFLGGGSVLLVILSLIEKNIIKLNGDIYAYDVNKPLIHVYKNIQSNCDELYIKLQNIIQEFSACGEGELNRKPKNINEAKLSKENYYYWIRNKYNIQTEDEKNSILGSALFIFLNKTCFRGIFRIGPNGFNVPYGNYKNPKIIDKEHLHKVSKLIKDVKFICCDFKTSLSSQFKEKDFIYLDPPYYPKLKNSFVGYTENGFNIKEHEKLFEMIHYLTNLKLKIIMSNSDVKFVRDNFEDIKYKTFVILCKRTINSKKPNSTTNEVIIKNY